MGRKKPTTQKPKNVQILPIQLSNLHSISTTQQHAKRTTQHNNNNTNIRSIPNLTNNQLPQMGETTKHPNI